MCGHHHQLLAAVHTRAAAWHEPAVRSACRPSLHVVTAIPVFPSGDAARQSRDRLGDCRVCPGNVAAPEALELRGQRSLLRSQRFVEGDDTGHTASARCSGVPECRSSHAPLLRDPLASSFAFVLALYPLYATLKGELLPGPGHVSLLGTDVNMVATRQGTGNVFAQGTVAHGTVAAWLSLDPWLLGLALLLSPLALVVRSTRAVALAFLIQVVMILRPGYLPAMYVIALLPFAALIVAGTTHTLWRFATDNHVGHRTRQWSAWVTPVALADEASDEDRRGGIGSCARADGGRRGLRRSALGACRPRCHDSPAGYARTRGRALAAPACGS